MIKKTYSDLELTVIIMPQDVIRTSEAVAPDVYEPDPFIEG